MGIFDRLSGHRSTTAAAPFKTESTGEDNYWKLIEGSF
jgi:hypothetical protein